MIFTTSGASAEQITEALKHAYAFDGKEIDKEKIEALASHEIPDFLADGKAIELNGQILTPETDITSVREIIQSPSLH